MSSPSADRPNWQRLTPDLGAGVPEQVDLAGCGDDYRHALDVSRHEYERLRETGVTTLCLFPIPPGQFYPLFPGHFSPSLPVPPADLDGLRRNVAAILGAGLA